MQKDFELPAFSKAILTAVFIGIMATLLTLGYDLFFTKELHFPLSEIINVSTLIFGVNLFFFFTGFIYYGFIHRFRKGDLFFSILMILLTIFLVWKAESAHRTSDPFVNNQFRDLLAGIIIILGLSAALALPFLYHNRKFQDKVI